MHTTHEPRIHQQRQIDHHARHLHAYDFFNLLTGTTLLDQVDQHLPPHRERLYPPTDTLSLFMAQSLNPDGACQQVVNRHAVDRIANGLKPCSTHTGAYCKARQRLPLEMNKRGQTPLDVNANFAAVPTSPTSTWGGTAVVAQGAGTVAATVAHAQFIYNSTDGALRFDADGTGETASAIVVGNLRTGLTLTASDFVFVA
jgi:hypothetical protein